MAEGKPEQPKMIKRGVVTDYMKANGSDVSKPPVAKPVAVRQSVTKNYSDVSKPPVAKPIAQKPRSVPPKSEKK